MEHRWGERRKVSLPVRVRTPFGVIGVGRVLDLSVSGAFITTTLPVRLFSRVEISVQGERSGRRAAAVGRGAINRSKAKATFAAQVVRIDDAGFAVEWQELGSTDLVALTAEAGLPIANHATVAMQ